MSSSDLSLTKYSVGLRVFWNLIDNEVSARCSVRLLISKVFPGKLLVLPGCLRRSIITRAGRSAKCCTAQQLTSLKGPRLKFSSASSETRQKVFIQSFHLIHQSSQLVITKTSIGPYRSCAAQFYFCFIHLLLLLCMKRFGLVIGQICFGHL